MTDKNMSLGTELCRARAQECLPWRSRWLRNLAASCWSTLPRYGIRSPTAYPPMTH